MKRRKVESLDVPAVPLNFLLTCSDRMLGDYELKKLADVANIRDELLVILDKYVEEMAQAGLVRWFREQDRGTLKRAIDEEEGKTVEWAKEQIRSQGRSDEGRYKLPNPSTFRPARPGLPPEKAHIARSLRYAARNMAAGKCSACPKPLDPNSTWYCTYHLAKVRDRKKEANKKRKKQRDA